LGIKAKLTGLKTLKLKESDRIVALKTELEKFGAIVEITDSSVLINENRNQKPEKIPTINTYNDHRMAMSFAPLALYFKQLYIQNPEVVSKSYPLFWEDLKSVGFSVNLQP
jgi:3-phosphoshikimate 1-carboxyvinyltransferase